MGDPGCGGRPGPDRFRTTRWSVIAAARDGADGEAREALAALCSTYWYPLYAFVRRKGHGPDAAEDLVQGFFARLLEGGLASVDPGKGKFRSFLLAACTHYLLNRADHDRAAKRGGGLAPITIDRAEGERRYGLEPAHDLTAERLFERRWALTLLETAVGRLEAEAARAGKLAQFEALRPALLGEAGRAPYAEIAAGLGISEEAARASASRLRRRLRELIREELAATLLDPAGLDDEVRDLFAALSG